jgi:hypothetical protein
LLRVSRVAARLGITLLTVLGLTVLGLTVLGLTVRRLLTVRRPVL